MASIASLLVQRNWKAIILIGLVLPFKIFNFVPQRGVTSYPVTDDVVSCPLSFFTPNKISYSMKKMNHRYN